MSWMEKLYQTYEQGSHLETFKAWPISHFVKTAHIEVVIDGNGNLKNDRIKLLSGEETLTLIPVTESSAGRSGTKIAPHPLCDELGYCAADLPERKYEKNQMFMNQLKTWCLSDYTHPKVQAIYRYLEQQSLWRDITRVIEFPLSFTNRSGQKTKVSADKAFVRWRVEEPGNPCSATWDDQELIEKWIQYDRANHQDEGVCYVSGACTRLIQNHSRFLRNSADGAKLISSNDDSGFTFRGRFLEAAEACGIGFDVSQKAHNALRWLISKHGFRYGDKEPQVFLSWAVSNKPIPSPFKNTLLLFEGDLNFDEQDDFTKYDDENVIDFSIDLGQSFALKLNRFMSGYAAQLQPNEQIIIMGIDSATPGRMGVVYYRELLSSEFLRRVEKWHITFSWQQNYGWDRKKAREKKFVGAPSPADISEVVYGHRDEKGAMQLDEKIVKATVERLLPCIIDSVPISWDLVHSSFRRAINRIGMKARIHNGRLFEDDWEKTLGISCALYKGYCQQYLNKNQHRVYAMALEEEYRGRDYLYGRLLAVAEYIEEKALAQNEKTRSTNAARLMHRFADRPYDTWLDIYKSLQPYIQRLISAQDWRCGFLKNRIKDIDNIMILFDRDEFSDKRPLTPEFLLGYHCQRQKFRTKTDTHEPNETEAQGDSE